MVLNIMIGIIIIIEQYGCLSEVTLETMGTTGYD